MGNESKAILDTAHGEDISPGLPLIRVADVRSAVEKQGMKVTATSASDLIDAYVDQVKAWAIDPPIDTSFSSFDVKKEYRHLYT